MNLSWISSRVTLFPQFRQPGPVATVLFRLELVKDGRKLRQADLAGRDQNIADITNGVQALDQIGIHMACFEQQYHRLSERRCPADLDMGTRGRGITGKSNKEITFPDLLVVQPGTFSRSEKVCPP